MRASLFEISGPYTAMKQHHAIGRVRRGCMQWRIGRRVVDVAPGALMLGRPGDVHQKLAGSGAIDVLVFDATRAPWPRHVEDCAALHALFDAVDAKADGFTLDVAIADALASLEMADDRGDFTQPVRHALDMLTSDMHAPITLDVLAAHAGLDKFRLCRAFRLQVGMAPHAYRVQFRVMRAKTLLRAGVSAKDAALQVGFYDQSQLTRHFRRIVGVTPAVYARG